MAWWLIGIGVFIYLFVGWYDFTHPGRGLYVRTGPGQWKWNGFRRRQYPVYCAWCAAKGRKTIVGWKPVPNSHGICEKCAEDVRRELEEYRRTWRDAAY